LYGALSFARSKPSPAKVIVAASSGLSAWKLSPKSKAIAWSR
jgi:hypothetical protein